MIDEVARGRRRDKETARRMLANRMTVGRCRIDGTIMSYLCGAIVNHTLESGDCVVWYAIVIASGFRDCRLVPSLIRARSTQFPVFLHRQKSCRQPKIEVRPTALPRPYAPTPPQRELGLATPRRTSCMAADDVTMETYYYCQQSS